MGADALITIGLTGPYCAGKDLVAKDFAERGFICIDVDSLGHDALQEAVEELTAVFGPDIRTSEGAVDRKRLGVLVFRDKKKLKKLESIVHPRMVESCIRLLDHYEKEGVPVVVINAALLHRMALDVLCDAICFVTAPLWTRYRRAKIRDGATALSFMRILCSQRDIKRSHIQGAFRLFLLKNSRDTAFIHRQVDNFCVTMGLGTKKNEENRQG